MRARTVAVVATSGLLLVLLTTFAVMTSQHGQGDNGVGLTYRGTFYSQSSGEVLRDRLGPVLEREVPVRETTTVVRAITGVDPEVAVAAHIDDRPRGGAAWLLMTPDEESAVGPWSDPVLAAVIGPEG